VTNEDFFNIIVPFILQNLSFIIFYFIVGFGPGFIAGILLANRIFGEGPTMLDTHMENIKKAVEHNNQWDPANDRWKK